MKKIVLSVILFMVSSTIIYSQELSVFENWLLKNTPIEEVKAKAPTGYTFSEKISKEDGIEYLFVRKVPGNTYKLIVTYGKDGKSVKSVSYEESSEKVWGRFKNIRDLGYVNIDTQVMGKVEVSLYENQSKQTKIGLILNENDMILKLNFMRL